MLTIFTPTYNRAHTLTRLFESLLSQKCKDFEWLVIDDGSTDRTEDLFRDWLSVTNGFDIRYYKVENGGKQRAINRGVELAEGELFFIVDSDDLLTPDATAFVLEAFATLPADSFFAGISCVKGDLEGKPLGNGPIFNGKSWVDATNIERKEYGLNADMAEVFYTKILKLYPFPVWKGEKFTPEAVVWDKMALDGYKLRWFDRVTYLCDYQVDGLSASFWKLLKDNPMGYAMLFNRNLEYEKVLKCKLNLILQYVSCCFLAFKLDSIAKCNYPFWAIILSPIGFILSIRRLSQIRNNNHLSNIHKVY